MMGEWIGRLRGRFPALARLGGFKVTSASTLGTFFMGHWADWLISRGFLGWASRSRRHWVSLP